MPIYEYECQSCRKRYEKLQKITDKPCTTCPSCGGPMRKLISSPAIQFKGEGFYITDYAKKNSPAGGGGSKDAGASEIKDAGEAKTSSAGSAPAKPKKVETLPPDSSCSGSK